MADPQFVPVDGDPFAQGAQSAQGAPPSSPPAPAQLVPVDHDPFAQGGGQAARSQPSPPQAPGTVYYADRSQPPSAAQQQAWLQLQNAGQLDGSKAWGDPAKPYVRRPDDTSFPEGASYIDFDGQVRTVPQNIGAMMPIAQAKAFSDLQAQGKLDRSQPIGSAANPIPWDGTTKLPNALGAYYVEPGGGVHYVGEMVDEPDYDGFGNSQGTHTSRPYVPDAGTPYGQQMAYALHALDTAARTVARGVPIAGPAAKYGNAAIDATAAKVGQWLNPDGSTSGGLDTVSPVVINGKHPAVSWGNLFDQALARENARDAQVDAQHPVASAAGQGVGTVAGLIADPISAFSPVSAVNDWRAARGASGEAGLLTRALAGGGDGVAVFGPDGYLRGQGAWDDPSRIHGALMEGGFGAVGGVASPLAFAGGEAAWNAGRNLFSPRTAVGAGTMDDLLTLLRDHGSTPAQVAQPAPASLDLAQGLQTHETGLGGTVKSSDMAGALARVRRAAERNGQTVDQMLDQVSNMGPHGMLADASGLTDLARATADRPSAGQQILEQNLNTRQQGTRDASTGLWDLPPASMRIVNAAAEGMGIGDKTALSEATDLADAQRKAAAPAYAKAYAAPAADLSNFADFVGSPMWRDAYARARGISEREFVDTPEGPQIQPLPERTSSNTDFDWRTLDLMKQSMDDMVSEGERKGIGANEMRASTAFRDAFVKKLDSLNKDYAGARQAYAGPASVIDAINAGKRFMSENPEGTAATFAALSPSEQEGFRLGAFQTLRDRLGNTDVTRNAAQVAGVLKPDAMARLQTLFPDAGAFADFSTKLQNENAFTNTKNAVLGGSRTSRNLGAQDDAAENPLEDVAHIAGAAHGNHESWWALVTKALPKPGQMSEGTANALGTILGTPGAAQNQTLRQTLEAAFRADTAKAAARAAAPKAGTAAGAATARAAAAGAASAH